MTGHAAIDLFSNEANRQLAAERIARLETMAVGDGLPITDYEARATDGRKIIVQATAVRVDTATGPATLSIMFDITARERVEAALRRSEAMLSHLFATSPDCIALSELGSGRHAMVNAAFTRVTGYAVARDRRPDVDRDRPVGRPEGSRSPARSWSTATAASPTCR